MATYLAKPSGPCCLTGHIHTGTPQGSFQPIANINTYVSHPAKPNGHILLYYADVFGLFNNAQLVMDEFASAGYLAVGLDYFNADPVTLHRDAAGTWTDASQTFEEWIAKYMAVADEYVPRWIEDVKATFGKEETKYVCVGYCFGAPYVCTSLSSAGASAQPVCSAGAFAHPAFLKEQHFRNLRNPLFLSCAETDHTFGDKDRNRAVEVLKEDGKNYQMQLFSKVKHGFALRCNLEDQYERMVKEKSLEGMVGWFDFWLGVSGSQDTVKPAAKM